MSNPPRLRDFPGFQRPRFCFSRQPTGRQRPAGRERQRELGRAVPCRRRERPLGAALIASPSPVRSSEIRRYRTHRIVVRVGTFLMMVNCTGM